MNLITNTYNPSELDGFSYAFIELTPELAALILKRRDVFKAIPSDQPDGLSDLAAMEYSDCSAVFLSALPDREEVSTEECDAGGEFDETTLTADVFADFAERTDCNRMVITSDAVYWTAYPHHSDRSLTVETCQIDYAAVELAAKANAEREGEERTRIGNTPSEEADWVCPHCGREYYGDDAVTVQAEHDAHPNHQCFEDCPGDRE